MNERNIQDCCDVFMNNDATAEMALALVKLEKIDIGRTQKVHLNAARKHVAEDAGTGHTDGVMYLRSVLETARCFPALTKAYEQLERESRLP